MVLSSMLAQVEGLFVWYNAVFVVFFGVGFFFTLMQLIGLGQASGADADTDADLDGHLDADGHVDVDTDADFDAHADVDAPADLDTDADVDAHVDADAAPDGHMDADADAHTGYPAHAGWPTAPGHSLGVGGALAQLIGLGKVPLTISLMLLCYTAGVVGWLTNELLAARMSPAQFFPLSLLAALVAAFLVIRVTSMFMARYLPTLATSAVHKRQLVGLTAKAVLPINERFGQACLYDKFGTLHMIGCQVPTGGKVIEKGASVVLIKYDPQRDLFVVGRA